MNIKYFSDTDTLVIDFSDKKIAETKDLNENVLVEVAGDGSLVSMTIEHARQIANMMDFSFQQVK